MFDSSLDLNTISTVTNDGLADYAGHGMRAARCVPAFCEIQAILYYMIPLTPWWPGRGHGMGPQAAGLPSWCAWHAMQWSS
jgi:hypothetical protein